MGGYSFPNQDDDSRPFEPLTPPTPLTPLTPLAPPTPSSDDYIQRLESEAKRLGVTPEAGWRDDLSRTYQGGDGNAARSSEDIFQSLMARQADRAQSTQYRTVDSQSEQGNLLYGSGTGNTTNTPGGAYNRTAQASQTARNSFGLPGTQFDDPYTKLLEQIALAQLGQAMQPLDTSGYDRLEQLLGQRVTELSGSPGFSPAEVALQRTQALEPIEQYRRASKQRAIERAAQRGFASPNSGLAELDMRDIDMSADRTRVAADRDLAITGMNQRRGDLNQALQLAVQLAQVPQQRRSSQSGNESQALNLATLLYQLPAQAQAQALAVINGTAPPSSLLNSVLQMQQQQQQQNQALWSQIGGLAAGLLG
jgi:hypothetical protein